MKRIYLTFASLFSSIALLPNLSASALPAATTLTTTPEYTINYTASALPSSPAPNYPALYYKYRPLGLYPASCGNYTRSTMAASGLQNISSSDTLSAGGTTSTARAFIACIPRPNSLCGTSGSTVMFVVSSTKSSEDALSVLNDLDTRFGKPMLIDCNQ